MLFNSCGVDAYGPSYWRRISSWILPSFFRRLGFPNVAEHMIVDTYHQSIQHWTRCLLQCGVVGVYWVEHGIMSIFDVALVPLSKKILCHRVLPTFKVGMTKLLIRKQIHICIFILTMPNPSSSSSYLLHTQVSWCTSTHCRNPCVHVKCCARPLRSWAMEDGVDKYVCRVCWSQMFKVLWRRALDWFPLQYLWVHMN